MHPSAVTVTDPPVDRPASPAPVDALVDALGVAWNTFTLYEHPQAMEAFGRAVATLQRCPSYPWHVAVSADGFMVDDAVVGHRREATLRLARRVFELGSAALAMTAPPSGHDLLHLFDVLAAPDAPEDINDELRRRGVRTVALLHRELFGSAKSAGEGKAWYLSYDGNPEPFVHGLLEGREADTAAVAAEFVGEYERVHGLLDPGDPWGREEVVHAFIDAFWYLPRRHQAQVFETMLRRQDTAENLTFLDQFGSLELAELNRLFGDAGHPLLAEYARVATAQGGRESADVDRLVDPDEAPTASLGRAVIDHIDRVLAALEESGTPAVEAALERLRSQRPGPGDNDRSSGNALGGLIDLEMRGEPLERPVAIWADKVADCIRSGDLAGADRWLAAPGRVGLGRRARARLLDALTDRTDTSCAHRLVEFLTSPPDDGPGSMLRRVAPLFAIDPLMAALGVEGTMARRKRLITALVPLARENPGALLRHLGDPRWFVVRNVALILGASGRSEVAGHLGPALEHPDHRVRGEALSASIRLDPASAAPIVLRALDDPNEAVRAKAGSLVSRIDDPAIDRALISRLEQAGSRSGMLAAVAALGRRRSAEALRVLEERAGRWFPFWGTTRAVRNAARAVLEEDHHG